MSGGKKDLAQDMPHSEQDAGVFEGKETKGDRTRRRILNVTEELLAEKPVWDLRSVDITRRAGVAPATFYSHFESVTEAVLELVETFSESPPEVVALATQRWSDISDAREFVRAHFDHWSRHRTAFKIRSITADAGEHRFELAEYRSVEPLLRAFSARFAERQQSSDFPEELDPVAIAGLFIAMLERTAAVLPRVEARGLAPAAPQIEVSALIEATAFIAFKLFGAEEATSANITTKHRDARRTRRSSTRIAGRTRRKDNQ
ncbi:TetR/AcrR family transcriptional regulator [Phenylobacterium sp. LjRoot219]|uniref:TetR/AcrR family transcriptional regulator n=1 Tax=Phenylobacterium sp. LjRoot219 TaxID=3342283 RepID=UPI003ED0F2D6